MNRPSRPQKRGPSREPRRPTINAARNMRTVLAPMRRGARTDHAPLVMTKLRGMRDPSACPRCGALFVHKTWRRTRRGDGAVLLHATRAVCPACRQVQRHEAFGVVRVHGITAAERESVLRRVWNVSRRAAFNQPERRLVLIRESADGIEIETTSQKLAHRIACELAKAFGGRSRFDWSDREGRLLATWDRHGGAQASAG
jgi:hypothetical protein